MSSGRRDVRLPRWVRQPSSSANLPAAEDVFATRRIDFRGRTRTIVCQGRSGPCSLIAACNVLILSDRITLPPDAMVVSESELLGYIYSCLTRNAQEKNQDDSTLDKFANVVLPKLTTGLDMNMNFTEIDGFEYNEGRRIFDYLNIPIYHGWIVDPQDLELAKAVGNEFYDTLIGEMKEFETDPANPLNTVEEAGTSTGINTAEHHKWKLFETFREQNIGQLTDYGVSKLHREIKDQELCVLFHHYHFDTLLKASVSHKDDTNCVWKMLTVNLGGEIVNSAFINPLDFTQQPSATVDEELARNIIQQEQNKNKAHKIQEHVGPTEASNSRSDVNNERKAIPQRKLINIENLLKARGGEKVAKKLREKNTDITELREALARKHYEETAFSDWFEPHEPLEVSNRLIPRSEEGKFSAYAATGISDITTMITENSSSSGSQEPHESFPQTSQHDNYADVTQPVEKTISEPKHLEVTEATKNTTSSGAPASKVTEETQNIISFEDPSKVSKAKSSKSSHSKVQKALAQKPPVPPKGNATRSLGLEPDASNLADQRGYYLRPRKENIIYAQSSSSAGKRRRPKNARRQNSDNAFNADVDLNDANTGSDGLDNNNLRRDGKLVGAQAGQAKHTTRRQSLKKPAAAKSCRAAKITPGDPALCSGKEQPQHPNRHEPLKRPAVASASSHHEESVSGDPPPSSGHEMEGDELLAPSEISKFMKGNVDATGADTPSVDAPGIEFTSDNAVHGHLTDGEYAGFEHHRISKAAFSKERLRFKAIGDALRYEEYCCILLNPDHFDKFQGNSEYEYGVGIVDFAVNNNNSTLKWYGLKESDEVTTENFEVGPHKLHFKHYCNERVQVSSIKLGDVQMVHAMHLCGSPENTFRALCEDLIAVRRKLEFGVAKTVKDAVKAKLRLK